MIGIEPLTYLDDLFLVNQIKSLVAVMEQNHHSGSPVRKSLPALQKVRASKTPLTVW